MTHVRPRLPWYLHRARSNRPRHGGEAGATPSHRHRAFTPYPSQIATQSQNRHIKNERVRTVDGPKVYPRTSDVYRFDYRRTLPSSISPSATTTIATLRNLAQTPVSALPFYRKSHPRNARFRAVVAVGACVPAPWAWVPSVRPCRLVAARPMFCDGTHHASRTSCALCIMRWAVCADSCDPGTEAHRWTASVSRGLFSHPCTVCGVRLARRDRGSRNGGLGRRVARCGTFTSPSAQAGG
ncbi:hypothetical protein BDW22DRAFT_1219053 [Trametopsis cervina]|nr:hypothetical protein BDW22DRAFT_1219053 [Trametopsis cervina]